MVEGSRKKTTTVDAVVAAADLVALGKAVVAAQNDNSDNYAEHVEKRFEELGAKMDRLSEQLKALQPAPQEHKMPAVSADPQGDKKQEPSHQAKQSDVIYVRNPTEFQFYS